MISDGRGRADAAAPRRSYTFGPLERRGLVAGLRGGQIAAVAAGLVLGVLLLRTRPGLAGGVAALVVVGLSAAVAAWPVAGRTPEEWAPVVLRWVLWERGRPPPSAGRHPAGSGGPRHGAPPRRGSPRGPAVLLGLDVLAVEAEVGSSVLRRPVMGVIRDSRAGTLTGVLAIRGHTFALLAPEDQERRIAGWAAALAAMARERSEVRRLQWIAMARPDDGQALRGYLHRHARLPPEHRAWRSYASLLTAAETAVSRHEVLLAVQVAVPGRARRAGAQGEVVARLDRAMVGVSRMLADGDVVVDGVLGPGALTRVVRAALHPGPAGAAAVADPSPVPAGQRCPFPAPLWWSERWDHLRTDATWHATYWVAEWPRVAVSADFLAPLLLGPVRRTISLVMEPVDQRRAARTVEAARTSEVADAELRRRGGFLQTARRVRESDALARREAELADGHGLFRFSGYVTVTALSEEGLADACARTEQAAGQARLELRRLLGDQGRGFTCALPLARGVQ